MSAADDAWQEWRENAPIEHREREAFMAGYRHALLDAADEVRASNEVYAYLRPASIETFLRARAAAVAPRETKD